LITPKRVFIKHTHVRYLLEDVNAIIKHVVSFT